MARKYDLPEFLIGTITSAAYERWLRRKAQAHVKRDRERGNSTAGGEEYRIAIHAAVKTSRGLDAYTGEPLHWHLISTYDNAQSKTGGRHYKRQFALLPSVDHVADGLGPASFLICGWATNDAKNDLAFDDFLDLCRKVLAHTGDKLPEAV